MNVHDRIATALSLRPEQVRATQALLDEGGTVPFISRYRKEATGSLDEVAITAIRDLLQDYAELDKRRGNMLASLTERDLLTEKLQALLAAASTMTELEDAYLPYRVKRRTRAAQARERGLEPLAQQIHAQDGTAIPGDTFINLEKGVPDADAALSGARDIIAEMISDDPESRAELRRLFIEQAELTSTVIQKKANEKKDESAKFSDYFDYSEKLTSAPSHRVLAMLRGQQAGFLRIQGRPDEERATARLARRYIRGRTPATEHMELAVADAYKRLICPSLENELLSEAKKEADAEAIEVFATNITELLLAAPLGRKGLLAIDPGYRTGCKCVVLDKQGALLHNTTIYPSLGQAKAVEAEHIITDILKKYEIEAIAVGNGTAGRETESFVKNLVSVPVILVDESGASIYSAGEVARKEFPDHDVTVRGSVSIGRRLQDPLAELVKLDPASIGVGQYQHDVDQHALKRRLDDVVMSSVNAIGVELNTASEQLLTYVSGLGPQLAKNIIQWRTENGGFISRVQLKKVPRLGAKAFEQAAGFLRIRGAKNPLDESAVHPERYSLIKQMAIDYGCTVADMVSTASVREGIDHSRYITAEVGAPTLSDIFSEMAKPGRDPRPSFSHFTFADIHSINDIQADMCVPGIVTNVTKFGAFVDIGVHQDGLVHISQLADCFVKDPADVVKVRQQVKVRIMDVDQKRKRIALSMKGL